MTYYAQDEIDKWLVEHCDLPEKGVIVDVGAGNGINMSNSKYFEDKDWKALCIDGDPRNTVLKDNRPNVELAVVSSKKELTFYKSKISPDISGAIKHSDEVEEIKVEGVTLEELLLKHKIDKIDILSIDTEGTEIEVFETMDWEKHKPHYLVIEIDTQGKVNLDIEPYFTSKGYKVIGVVGPNMIFEYPQPIKRDPHLIVYGSSYDRGLEHLLKMWPDIKSAVPDARLRIFYGWHLFDLGYRDNPERMAWKEKINKLMEQDGITHLGRISHGAVAEEFKKAGIWAYPTHFGEISCITAMKAQANGAIPCVIDYAALKETVQFGIKIKGDIYDQEIKDLYKGALIALLNDEKHQDAIRDEMMEWAKHFAWSNVAKQWDGEFRREITPEERAMQLILADEPIEALRLLNEDSPLRQKLVRKLDHMFNPEKYKQKYADDPMNWKPGIVNYPRHDWILKEAKDAKTLIDLGCYEGSLVYKFGKGARGVEMCKAAKDTKRNIVTGDATTYQDGKKYDAVCACEIIEHLPDPQKLIDNMLSLVSEDGWCYITTPNGCYDVAAAQKVWDDPEALIDHVRTYNKEKIERLLAGCDVAVTIAGKELYVKFRRNISNQVEELLENNQALKAWDLVKDTDHPLKEKVWPLVEHAFNPERYRKYYSEELIENPLPEDMALDCTNFYPRFKWLVEQIMKQQPTSVVDLGCADGYLCLTLAKRDIPSAGYNLYEPSIKIARERAKKYGLDAEFHCKDLMEVFRKYDAVVLFEVLEHLPEPQKVIDHCMSLVNPGGSFYLSTPSPDHWGIKLHKEEDHGSPFDGKPSGHLQIFTEEELREMLKAYKIIQFITDEQGCYLLEVRNE